MDGHTGDWGIEQYKKGTTAEQPDPGEDADYPSRGGLAGVKLLYSTMAPHFSLPQFLETFLLNLTLPLPYPYFFWKYGWGFLFSMQLSPFRKVRIDLHLLYIHVFTACGFPLSSDC